MINQTSRRSPWSRNRTQTRWEFPRLSCTRAGRLQHEQTKRRNECPLELTREVPSSCILHFKVEQSIWCQSASHIATLLRKLRKNVYGIDIREDSRNFNRRTSSPAIERRSETCRMFLIFLFFFIRVIIACLPWRFIGRFTGVPPRCSFT